MVINGGFGKLLPALLAGELTATTQFIGHELF
jgi:hypothetical protein